MEKQLDDLKINDQKEIRHCAFCLTSVASQDVKLCGGCRKRAYCSKECQVADWSLKKDAGQGHKNWCKLGCGEEDIDWEVCPVPGKGLGLIAKRLIPAKFRIIVDAVRPRNHPAIEDLTPKDGTIEDKFLLNCLDCDTEGEDSMFLRIARANHSCDANADHYFDETFKVKILFSEREIQEGEEICINYQPFNDVSKDRTAESTRLVLSIKWGVVCPDQCLCRNKEINEVVLESKELDSAIFNFAQKGKAAAALNAVNKLMENHEIMRSSLIAKERTLYDGFQIAQTKPKTYKYAGEFIRRAYDIASSILSPQSAKCLKFEKWIKGSS